jgi:hypothetical protein
MTIITLAALILTIILLFLSGLHVYWAGGGKWGSSAVLPTQENSEIASFKPPPIATLAVAVVLFISALLVALDIGWFTLPLPNLISRIGVWMIAFAFALRALGDFKYVGLFRKVSGTDFSRMDARLYTPLCVILSALAFIISLS